MARQFFWTLLCVVILSSCLSKGMKDGFSEIKAPYSSVSGTFSGEDVSYSPDPLVAMRWERPKYTDSLEVYVLSPTSFQVDSPENISIKNPSDFTVKGACNLRFDFGRVSAAWFEFESADLEGEVEMSISEYNEPAIFNKGAQHPKKTAKPVRYGNTWRLELNDELYEGVRFAWIHIYSLKKKATISSVRLVCQVKPTNYEGSFSCSDTLLTRIWYTGAYTVKLNLLQNHFGAILMERSDRHSWTGDAHTSQAASLVAFGNFDFVKENIRYTSDQFNGIASYSLYWVLSLLDYYRYTGDRELLDEMLENVCSKLDIAYEHYGTDPKLAFYGWDERLGAGFENPDCEEAQNAYKMLSIRTWYEFSDLMEQIDCPDLAIKYKKYADEKVKVLRKDSKWFDSYGIHAASDAIMAKFINDAERDYFWKNDFSDRMQRISYSPFNQYFILKAMAELGRLNEALTTVDDCWGGQIRYGGTTFFEVFHPSWNLVSGPNDAPINNQCGFTSLTHPWSAGVTKWLSEEIAGIKPTGPGFSTFIIKPHLSSRVTWVKGITPTPHGKIEVCFDIESGEGSFSIPADTKAELAIPKAGYQIDNIEFSSNEAKKSGEDGDFVYYSGFSSGQYQVKVKYSGKMAEVVSEPFEYEYENFHVDSVTQGNWIGKYGSKGYLLCNYDSLKNRTKLPAFIERVDFNNCDNIHWKTGAGNPAALLSDTDNAQRSLGAVVRTTPAYMTMTVDIYSQENKTYKLSLYFADGEKRSLRSAIELFNLDDKKRLTPVYIIRDYSEGKYVTVELDQPVRVRINHVRGERASLSGLFFD